MSTIDVQIWNNAAFDNRDSTTLPSSSSSSSSNELDSLSTKENLCPSFCTPTVCRNSQFPINPLSPTNLGVNVNSQGKQPFKVLFKQELLPPIHNSENHTFLGHTNIDAEIQEIEAEICRLSLKLKSLRLQKEEDKTTGSFRVSDQKQTSKGVSFFSSKIEVGNGVKSNRKGMSMGPSEIISLHKGKQERTPIQSGKGPRGISLGPSEIAAGTRLHKGQPEKIVRKAMSIGPSEIIAGGRSQKRGKQELTPILSSQKSRRKSCFYKLQNVKEDKVTKGRSLSLSPKSRQSNALIQSKQRFATIGSNKIGKKDDHILSSIQPKNLFKEGDISAVSKRLYKSGRVVASRYSQCSASQRQNDPRKMSLPGYDRSENTKRPSVEMTRVFLPESGSNQGTESKQEVSSQTMQYRSLTHNSSPPTLKVGEFLPKLRIIPSRYDSPRDSGPAKKVADLVGRKFYFAEEKKSTMEDSVCQTLRFDEEEE